MTDVVADILARTSGLDRPAVLGALPVTHRELQARADDFARLLSRHGVARQRAVAVALPHGLPNILAVLANWQLGAVSVPVNFRATPDERAYILANSGARHLIAPTALRPDPSLTLLDTAGEVAIYRTATPAKDHFAEGDAVVIHTSGSTNRPKGVVLTRRCLSANVAAVAASLDLTASDRCALFTPPSFAYAFSQILTHLWVGGAVLPWPLGLLDIPAMLQALDREAVTGIQANPTMFEMLLASDDLAWPPMTSVRYVMSGGQPLFSHLIRRLEARFPNARFASMYGLTENSPRVSFGWLPRPIPDRATAWPVGTAVAGTRLRVRNATGDADVPPGEPGEIEVSGASLMRGYLGANAPTPEWFRTRDGGVIDADGNLNLVGRLDNIFSVGHEKVSPEEIESLLAQLDGIDDVAVSHAPHNLLGSATVVVFTATSDTQQLPATIRETCTRSLSRAKFPHHIFRIEAVPKTLYGKIDRPALRTLAAALVAHAEQVPPLK